MQNELTLERFGYNKENNNENETVNILKKIGTDSLFYFAIFLAALGYLQLLPYLGGIFDQVNIGINEVLVSVVGFANVFFLQVYNKIFKKAD